MKEIGSIPGKSWPFESTPGHPKKAGPDKYDIIFFIKNSIVVFVKNLHLSIRMRNHPCACGKTYHPREVLCPVCYDVVRAGTNQIVEDRKGKNLNHQ